MSGLESDGLDLNLFKQSNKIADMNLNGLDFITPDISKSYKKMGRINELNGGPCMKLHMKPTNIKDNIPKKILKAIFKN